MCGLLVFSVYWCEQTHGQTCEIILNSFIGTFRAAIAALILFSGLVLHAAVACIELCGDNWCGIYAYNSESHDHCDCEPLACASLHEASFVGPSIDRVPSPDLSMPLSMPHFMIPQFRSARFELLDASLPGEAKTVCALRTGITVLRT